MVVIILFIGPSTVDVVISREISTGAIKCQEMFPGVLYEKQNFVTQEK